jgi:predicted nucleic acid-binding protein
MIYLLDTNSISRLVREDAEMAAWLRSVGNEDHVVTCTIARGEVLFGVKRLAQGRRRNELETKTQALFAALGCEAVPPGAGDHYADVKLAQQRRGLSLDENDLWIAATALAIGATLVTRDSDFAAIDALEMISP